MYKVIGSDNREYGPASEETVRRWIAEGRANGASQGQAEGETGWRALSTFPEFAAALAAGLAPPATQTTPSPTSEPAAGTSPGAASPWGAGAAAGAAAASGAGPGGGGMIGISRIDADALASRLCARVFQLDIGSCIGRGFQLVQDHFGLVIGAWAVSFLVQWSICIFVPWIGEALGFVLGAVFLGGLHFFFLKLARGERAAIGDVFAGFGPALGPLILVGVVSCLLETVGFFLCVLPFVYLVVAWHYAAILVLDKNVDFWAAMELSRKVVTRHWFGVFGLGLLAILMLLGGFLVCCIGLFVAGPIASAAMVYGYRDLFEEPAA
jgi:hypothetical protein